MTKEGSPVKNYDPLGADQEGVDRQRNELIHLHSMGELGDSELHEVIQQDIRALIRFGRLQASIAKGTFTDARVQSRSRELEEKVNGRVDYFGKQIATYCRQGWLGAEELGLLTQTDL